MTLCKTTYFDLNVNFKIDAKTQWRFSKWYLPPEIVIASTRNKLKNCAFNCLWRGWLLTVLVVCNLSKFHYPRSVYPIVKMHFVSRQRCSGISNFIGDAGKIANKTWKMQTQPIAEATCDVAYKSLQHVDWKLIAIQKQNQSLAVFVRA